MMSNNNKAMRLFSIYMLFLSGLTLISCQEDESTFLDPVEVNDDFSSSMMDWSGDFADYPSEGDTDFELSVSHEALPAPLDQSKNGIRISGNNRSDDLFMFIKKKVDGLKANQRYRVRFTVNFASNAASNQVGVGGAPGESVYVGAGFSVVEPMKTIDSTDNYYRMNIDKMQQAQDGASMKVIGDIANGTEENNYVLISRTGEFTGQADENGSVWLIVGTDSGFESVTTLYYTGIKAVFQEMTN